MTRLFALAFFALIPSLIGFWHGEKLRKEVSVLGAVSLFLAEIEKKIELFSATPENIFTKFENSVLEKNLFLPSLRKEVTQKPVGAMKRALEEVDLGLQKKDREVLFQFSEDFGMLSRERQLEKCENTFLYFSDREKEEAASLPEKLRLSRAIGISAGAGLLILLI